MKLNTKEIEDRLNRNLDLLARLNKTYIKAFAPKEGGGTSYNDYDCIHGSTKEYRVEDYCMERQKLENLIALDKELLIIASINTDDEEYLKGLSTNEQKIRYLRFVKGYTQRQTADMLEVSVRQVQRIEKKLKCRV